MTESLEHPSEPTHIIGIDNGTSATGIALIGPGIVKYDKLPIKNELSYTKEEHHITRIDVPRLRTLFLSWNLPIANTKAILERPMINPTRFRASISAVRCLEAELVVLEELGIDYDYIDSKVWQQVLLPNVVGSDELKKASLKLGPTLYPQFKFKKDADALLIAHWYKYKPVLPPKPKKTL